MCSSLDALCLSFMNECKKKNVNLQNLAYTYPSTVSNFKRTALPNQTKTEINRCIGKKDELKRSCYTLIYIHHYTVTGG